jgi:tight adherence protein B
MDANFAAVLTAALAFVAVAAAGWAFTGSGGEAALKRVRAIGAGRRSGAGGTAASGDAGQKRKLATADALKQLARKQKSSRMRQLSIKGQLEQAAINAPPHMFWAVSAVLGLGAGGGLFFVGAPILAILGAAIAAGLGLPRWILAMLIGFRHKRMSNQLADAIDVIVRGVKSGLPLNQCMQIIAKESPMPLREEFKRIVDGQAMGVPLEQNLQRFFDRVPLPEVNFFSIVLIIQQRAGGNLAEALSNLSAVLRARKMLREKIKALSAEAKMSAIIIGSMPFVVMAMLMVVNPEYIMILFNTDVGRMILMICAATMITGVMVMRSMINFKF